MRAWSCGSRSPCSPRTRRRSSRMSGCSWTGLSPSPPAPTAAAPASARRPGPRRSGGSTSATPAPWRSATWPGGCAVRMNRPRRLAGVAATGPRLVRGDRARLPFARTAVGHAVGRRGAAHQDGPPTRLLLTDVTYVFDEPTAGLHPHDVQQMNELLFWLRDKGNTLLVVEHEPETIAIADHVVDWPGAA